MKFKKGQIVKYILNGESVVIIDCYGHSDPSYMIRTRNFQAVEVHEFELEEKS